MQAGLSVGPTTVKEIKSLRKQADKAERIAQAVADVEMSQRYMSMAWAYRSQADILKAKRKAAKQMGQFSNLYIAAELIVTRKGG